MTDALKGLGWPADPHSGLPASDPGDVAANMGLAAGSAALVTFALIFVFKGMFPQAPPTGTPIAVAPNPGPTLYARSCGACHGPTAEGVPGLGKDMTTSAFVRELSDDELVAFIKQGRGVDDPANTTRVAMPPYGGNANLSDEELGAIVGYVRSLAKPIAPVALSEGARLYRETCAACHGLEARGLPGLGKDMTSSAFVASLDDAGLVDFVRQGRPVGDHLNTTRIPMPPRGGNPDLNDSQLEAIVGHVRELVAQAPPRPEVRADGAALYTETCAACHGPDAKGLPFLGKDLTTSPFANALSDAELVAFIRRGRETTHPDNTTKIPMPPSGGNSSLTDAELSAIVTFLRALRDGGPPPAVPTEGTALYAATCAACHGPDGRGLPGLGKDLTTSSFVRKLDDAGLVAFIKKGRGADDPLNTTQVPMPPYGGNPSLDDAQLQAIVTAVRELGAVKTAPAAPSGESVDGAGLYARTCAACHGADGRGLPYLGKDLTTSPYTTEKSLDEALAFVKKGRGVDDPENTTKVPMPPMGGNPALSDAELRGIMEYVRSLAR